MQIFRFINPNTLAVRLNLNDNTRWLLGEGLDVGKNRLAKNYLNQPGVDGTEQASAWYDGPEQMTVPLILMPQVSQDAIQAAVDLLNTELDRDVNCIEALPYGLNPAGGTYLIDTFRADKVSTYDGESLPNIWRRRDAKIFQLAIERQSPMRGRGAIF